MGVQSIISKLSYGEGPYPAQALSEAVERREEIIPELLKILEREKEEPERSMGQEDYMLCVHSIYLLAHFRVKEAYALILDLFSRTEEKALELIGNMFIEDLGRILASVSCGDTLLIQSLIENQEANELVRASALESLLVLLAVGEKTRDEIIAFFRDLFRGKLERKPSLVWNSLVTCCVDLHPEELLDDIMQCFDDELIDEDLINMDQLEEILEVEKEEVWKNFQQKPNAGLILIKDVIKELEEWSDNSDEEV